MKSSRLPFFQSIIFTICGLIVISVQATETFEISGVVEEFYDSSSGTVIYDGTFAAILLYDESTEFQVSSVKSGSQASAEDIGMALDVSVFDASGALVFAGLLAYDAASVCPDGQSTRNTSTAEIASGGKKGSSISVWYNFYCIASGVVSSENSFEIYARDKTAQMTTIDDVTSAFPDLELLNGYAADLWFYQYADEAELSLSGAIQLVAAGPLDSDGDGFSDDIDYCINSDLSPTVVVGGIDTGVDNTLDDTGCTIADQTAGPEGSEPLSGGELNQVTNDLKKDGVITGAEKGAITSAAAKERGNGKSKNKSN